MSLGFPPAPEPAIGVEGGSAGRRPTGRRTEMLDAATDWRTAPPRRGRLRVECERRRRWVDKLVALLASRSAKPRPCWVGQRRFFEAPSSDLEVYLGGRQVGVAEEALDFGEGGAGVDEEG